jgi:biopolymer transport protein ExbD
MKSNYQTRSGRPSVDSMMTPMIDVVFLLLIFFLTTSSFQRLEQMLPSAVSAASSDQAAGTAPLVEPTEAFEIRDTVIKIQLEDGRIRYRLNGQPIDAIDVLSQRIAAITRIRSDAPIIIEPEDAVPAGQAIRIYDLAKASGSMAVYLVGR